MKELEEKIYQAIGEASMCWKETPGVFDDVKAKKIGEDIWVSVLSEIQNAYQEGWTDGTNHIINGDIKQ